MHLAKKRHPITSRPDRITNQPRWRDGMPQLRLVQRDRTGLRPHGPDDAWHRRPDDASHRRANAAPETRGSALDEGLLDHEMAGLAMAALEKTAAFKGLAQLFKHARAATHHDPVGVDVQRRQADVVEQLLRR